jgi:PAS domain S-box-containing protein
MSLRVLFVEDDPADMELALYQLRKAGMNVASNRVSSPGELQHALSGPPPDIVLCDYHLPSWTGLEALAQVKESTPDTPVILLTGDLTEERVLQCRKLGAAELVYKDRLVLLPAAVESVIAGRRTLEELQDRYRILFGQAPSGIAMATPEGKFLEVNAAFSRIVGYTQEELLGGMDWGSLLAGGEGDAWKRAEDGFQADARFRRKDSRMVDVDWRLTPMCVRPGRTVAIIGQITDISRRKQDEGKLRHYAMVLDRSNQELQQFVYAASHDLQEPLRMVRSYLELLARRYKGKLDADADEFIGYAVDGAARMQTLISGLLAYSRISTHGQERQVVDCGLALKEAVANLRLAIEEAGALVESGPLPEVLAEPTQVTQMFQNLIANALKFRSEAAPRIRVSAERQGPVWCCTVRDNGIGIDPRFHGRIFEMFQRLHGVGVYPGSGIGLALCRRIAERHGGKIWVESEAGKGAAFHFTLPSAAGAQEVVHAPAA